MKLAFCAKCNQERPVAKLPLMGRKGPLKKKVPCCYVCRERVFVSNKYGAVKTRSKLTGKLFDSKKEARREPALVAMQQAGHICELKYQVPFRLEVYSTQAVDALLALLYEKGTEWADRDIDAAMKHVELSRQRIANYIADFQYLDDKGNVVVEDVKGARTAAYNMKRRLMRSCHNVEIVEPSDGGVQQKARGAGVKGAHTGSRFRGGG